LAEQCARLEQTLVAAEARGATLGDEVAQLRAEIETVRHDSADRAALATRVSELGTKIGELDQQLAAANAENARIDRQRTALAEEADEPRRQQAETLAATERERAALQETLTRLTEEHTRLETERSAQAAELQTQRTAATQLQAAVESTRAEQARGEDDQ